MELTEEHHSTITFLKKFKVGTPTKVGEHLGYDYYKSTSAGSKLLTQLMWMGKVKRIATGKYILA